MFLFSVQGARALRSAGGGPTHREFNLASPRAKHVDEWVPPCAGRNPMPCACAVRMWVRAGVWASHVRARALCVWWLVGGWVVGDVSLTRAPEKIHNRYEINT